MSPIQNNPTSNPLDNAVLAVAIDLILKADAMGLLTRQVDTLHLQLEDIIQVARDITSHDIGLKVVISPERWREYSSEDLCKKLLALIEVLEDSPLPETEWARLGESISDEILSMLLVISEQSVRRYASGERHTPDDVVARLHFLCLVVGDLRGAYNEDGVRNWFKRPRKSFGGRAPLELLAKEPWSPTDKSPTLIRNFAKSLVEGMGA